jgi:hypothetical protein
MKIDKQAVLGSVVKPVVGAGLGLRRCFIEELTTRTDLDIDFLEVAPENWIGMGGRFGKSFRAVSERYPVTLHGLSLNLGGYTPIDLDLVKSVKAFMAQHGCPLYTEHLSYCADQGHLYDLMPIPFSEEAVKQTAERIRLVQDVLGQRIAIENVSYYAAPGQQMTELEFINAVVSAADCDLLLDVNNIYVNAINHRYDPVAFLHGLPGERARYIHIAGHFDEAEDLRVDTHGADVIDPVWDLLREAYAAFGVLPTLLERDFNIPSLDSLMAEVDSVRGHQLYAKTQAPKHPQNHTLNSFQEGANVSI